MRQFLVEALAMSTAVSSEKRLVQRVSLMTKTLDPKNHLTSGTNYTHKTTCELSISCPGI